MIGNAFNYAHVYTMMAGMCKASTSAVVMPAKIDDAFMKVQWQDADRVELAWVQMESHEERVKEMESAHESAQSASAGELEAERVRVESEVSALQQEVLALT